MRTRIPIIGDVAVLLQRIVLDRERFTVPVLPPVVGGKWGDIQLDGLWGPLRTEGPSLFWEPSMRLDAPEDAGARLRRIDALRNDPASLELADGTRVVAAFGHTPRWGGRVGTGPGPTCEFNVWRIEGGAPVARWVGQLKGGGFLNANLVVSAATRFSASNACLKGNFTWYLLDTDRDADDGLIVVVDGGSASFDHDALRSDFNALQVALGAPLQLDVLVGLDGPGNVIGAAGIHFGGNRAVKRSRRADGPVPDEISDECWLPVFFHRLAKAMVDEPDLPWGVACVAYLDSLSDATIDGRYLKLHVALEAFAKALLKRDEKTKAKARLLVKNGDAWVKWVQQHANELREFLDDSAREQAFIGKVISAMNLPSSGVVADALSRLEPPLLVDQTALDELDKRNIPAHHFTMNKPGVDYEVDRDVQRVDVLRSLFVALITRACRYDGAIAGWVTDEAAAWKPQPGWWPPPSSAALEEARVAFTCEREPHRPFRPRRFQSRLRTRSSQKKEAPSRR